MKNLLYLIITVAIFSSCEMVVDIDVPRQPDKLVVNCVFEEGDIWEARVSKSNYILDDSPISPINNAIVQIFDKDQLVTTLSPNQIPGYYVSTDSKPIANKEYQIRVSAPGFEAISGSATTKSSVEIISSKYTRRGIPSDYLTYDEVELVFEDIEGESYYEISVIAYQYNYGYDEWGEPYVIDSFPTSWHLTSNDPSIEQDEIDLSNAYFIDFLGDKRIFSLKFLVEKFGTDNLHIQLKHISKEYYQYRRTSNNARWNSGNPFSEPVQVFTNINKGYGIFAGYGSNMKKIDPL